MSVDGIAKSIEAWNASKAMRGLLPGTEWYFPIMETCHVLALGVVLGTIVIVDLRLLGVSARSTRASALMRELLPWTWGAWCLALVFGSILFVAHAHSYLTNRDFILKFVCMGLAAINMAVFHFGAFKDVAKWDAGEPVPAAKLAGGISIALWVAVVYFGRLVGFSGV